MIYKPFQSISLSRLGMGNMRLPTVDDKPDAPIDYDRAQQIIDEALAQGINYFDTAYRYHSGGSEPFLGQALSAYDRGSYCLATKFSYDANPDYKAVFAEQREKLRTDYLDFYLLHAVGDGNVEKYLSCAASTTSASRRRRARSAIWASPPTPAWRPSTKCSTRASGTSSRIQLNYFDWVYGTAKAEYEAITARGIPVMVMESVRGGRLAKLSPEAEAMLKAAHPDWSIPAWAFRWLQRLPGVQVCLSGMSNLDQLHDNLATMSEDRPLTDDEERLLFEAAAAFRREVSVPCTGCRYCYDGCPAEINIPRRAGGLQPVQDRRHLGPLPPEGRRHRGQARRLRGLRRLPEDLSQGIEIPKLMAELAEAVTKLD